MFKIQVWYDNHWKEGISEYSSMEEVEQRLERLKAVGIKARLMPEDYYARLSENSKKFQKICKNSLTMISSSGRI